MGGVAATLVFAAFALAGVATSVSAYGGEGGRAQASVSGAVNASSNLPFTGVNLGLIVLAGLVLVAAGLLLRRRARSTT